MSAAQSEAAVERVAARRRELGEAGFSAYAFLALGLLAWNAPEVLRFILDRTDEQLPASGSPAWGWRDVQDAARAALAPHHLGGHPDGLECQNPGAVDDPGPTCRFIGSDAPDRHSTTEAVQS